jgi:hypothetical protein
MPENISFNFNVLGIFKAALPGKPGHLTGKNFLADRDMETFR